MNDKLVATFALIILAVFVLAFAESNGGWSSLPGVATYLSAVALFLSAGYVYTRNGE